LRIEDNGDGIPPEQLQKVFQPFFSTRPKKAGLGLTIAERVVRLHGGELQIVPIPAGGTTVTISIPIEP
jgi:signal transduction histidine kinase